MRVVIFREGDVSGAPRLIHVIASEAKQSIAPLAEPWIASSLRFSQ
jgi:hypothetical protein